MNDMVLIKTNTRYHKPAHKGKKLYTWCGKRANKAPWKSIPRRDADASGYTPCSECYKDGA